MLARDLARLLNGAVELVESSPAGSTFSFSFPLINSRKDLIESVIEEETLEPIENKEAPILKLLLVEDNKELTEYTRNKLSGYFQVRLASDGISALDAIRDDLPDIVISDVAMPKMNGLQLCISLKQNMETCHIPVILLTGLDSKEHIVQGLDSGADDYIIKPFDFDLLLSKAETLVKNRKVLKEKFLVEEGADSRLIFNQEMDNQFMQELLMHIEENISDENFSAKDLCEVMGMSRTSFYHKLRTLIDTSPNEFIRTIRLKKGRSLLVNNNFNISEVAYKVGFSDAKYFSTLFKKYYGETPTSFLSNLKKN